MSPRTIAALAAALAAVIGLSACTTHVPEQEGALSEDCTALFDATPAEKPADGEPDPTRVVVLGDPTASSAPLSLGEAGRAVIAAAARTNGTVSVLTVDGVGASATWLGSDLPLNVPGLASDTAQFGRVAEMAPTCVEQLVATGEPTVAGSDILTGMQLAGAKLDGAGEIVVVTDGVANAGILDFAKQPYGTPAAEVVAAIDGLGQLPHFDGATVTIVGVGGVAGAPLNQVVVDWMVSVYQGICEASGAAACTVEAGTAQAATVRADLPDDAGIAFPVFEAPVLQGEDCVYTIGSAILFGGNSSELSAAADQPLSALIAELQGTDATVLVQGHTTTFGDPAYNQQLSTDRATSVAQRLAQLGLDPSRVTSEGLGGTQPRVTPDHEGDRVIESAASQNRRVEFVVSGLASCG